VHRTPRLLAFVAILSLLPTVALAEPDLQRELDERQRQRQQTEQELGTVRAQEGTAKERLSVAQQALEQARSALAASEAELAEARTLQAEAQAVLAEAQEEQTAASRRVEAARSALQTVLDELAATEAELAENQRRLEARIRAAYKYGQVSFAEAFAGVRDITDFLNSSTYVGKVMENDRGLVESVVALLGEVEVQRAEAHQLRLEAEHEAALADRAAQAAARAEAEARAATEQVATAVREQARQTEAVAAQRAELEAALDEIVEDRQSIEGHLAGLEADSARLQGELAALARQRAEEARQREAAEREAAEREAAERAAAERAAAEREREADPGNGDGGAADPPPSSGGGQEATPSPPPASDGWAWPAACRRVTSYYGSRWGRTHQGVDIACTRVMPSIPPIYASRGGVVSHLNCGTGYGICVIVDHLDGDFSLYAHLSSQAVGRGQTVQRGQVLGYEGSTGNSTGPHLHFEIWKGGVRTNPCPYIGC
jgi:murein DD-endopeptidase MepM/ murein hydrolase activator NlpD